MTVDVAKLVKVILVDVGQFVAVYVDALGHGVDHDAVGLWRWVDYGVWVD